MGYRKRKLILENGTHSWGLNVEHLVTKGTFAKALADHHWEERSEFDPNMTKAAGMRLLRHRLEWAGRQGIDTTLWEGASQDFGQPHNDAYAAALEWIEKNYPYL